MKINIYCFSPIFILVFPWIVYVWKQITKEKKIILSGFSICSIIGLIGLLFFMSIEIPIINQLKFSNTISLSWLYIIIPIFGVFQMLILTKRIFLEKSEKKALSNRESIQLKNKILLVLMVILLLIEFYWMRNVLNFTCTLLIYIGLSRLIKCDK